MKLLRNRKKTSETPRIPQANVGRAPVYSYHSLRDTRLAAPRETAPPLIKANQQPILQLVIRRATLGLCVLVLLWGLWLQPRPEVTLISLTGTVHQDRATYQDQLQQLWSKRLLNQTKVTIQADKLSQEIEAMFPEIESARVELPLLGRVPNVVITPGTPVLLLVTQKGAFYVSATGKTMIRNDDAIANNLANMPTVRDDSGLVPELGKSALPMQQIQTLIALTQLCAAAHIDLDSVVLPVTPNEVDLTVKGTNYAVKFSLAQDARQGIGALVALRDKFKADGTTPSSYVDLRVPDKAFYK